MKKKMVSLNQREIYPPKKVKELLKTMSASQPELGSRAKEMIDYFQSDGGGKTSVQLNFSQEFEAFLATMNSASKYTFAPKTKTLTSHGSMNEKDCEAFAPYLQKVDRIMLYQFMLRSKALENILNLLERDVDREINTSPNKFVENEGLQVQETVSTILLGSVHNVKMEHTLLYYYERSIADVVHNLSENFLSRLSHSVLGDKPYRDIDFKTGGEEAIKQSLQIIRSMGTNTLIKSIEKLPNYIFKRMSTNFLGVLYFGYDRLFTLGVPFHIGWEAKFLKMRLDVLESLDHSEVQKRLKESGLKEEINKLIREIQNINKDKTSWIASIERVTQEIRAAQHRILEFTGPNVIKAKYLTEEERARYFEMIFSVDSVQMDFEKEISIHDIHKSDLSAHVKPNIFCTIPGTSPSDSDAITEELVKAGIVNEDHILARRITHKLSVSELGLSEPYARFRDQIVEILRKIDAERPRFEYE